jgi:hypothetical protein
MSARTNEILQKEIIPRLCGSIPHSVRCVGAESSEDLVADGIAMAARMLARVESQGKLDKVSPGNIAYYTIQHLKSGRRANGISSVDIMASGTQLNGASQLHSLNEVVSQSEAGDEIFELHDVISNDHEDPSIRATRKLDWDAFLGGLGKVERIVVEFLYAGKTLRQAGRSVGVGDSTMQTYRKKITAKIVEFMGADILRDIAAIPNWRIGLDCERALLACRADRRH